MSDQSQCRSSQYPDEYIYILHISELKMNTNYILYLILFEYSFYTIALSQNEYFCSAPFSKLLNQNVFCGKLKVQVYEFFHFPIEKEKCGFQWWQTRHIFHGSICPLRYSEDDLKRRKLKLEGKELKVVQNELHLICLSKANIYKAIYYIYMCKCIYMYMNVYQTKSQLQNVNSQCKELLCFLSVCLS